MKSSIIATGFAMLLCNHISAATVAYYRFEEGASGVAATVNNSISDSSGNNLNGTPVGNPLYSSLVPVTPVPMTEANNGLALNFNGSSSRIFVPDAPAFQLTAGLTLEAYFFARVNAGNIIFRGDNRVGLDPYRLWFTNGRIGFKVEGASGQSSTVSTLVTGNRWVHVAGTLDDATGQMNLYIDGVLDVSIVTSVRPLGELNIAQNPGIGIGNVQSGNFQEYFNGMIDEVRISNTALAPEMFLNVPEPTTSALVLFAIPLLNFRRLRSGK